MDDTRTERLVGIAVWSIWIGLTIPTYRHLAAAARLGGNLSLTDHVSLFILAVLVVPLYVVALVIGLGLVGWALAAGAWMLRRAWRLVGGRVRRSRGRTDRRPATGGQ